MFPRAYKTCKHIRLFLYARNIAIATPSYSRWSAWEVVIGIEVHAQIKSRQKLFSNSPTPRLADSPNSCMSAFDAAWPGTLPKLNQKCVELAMRTALACGSQIQARSTFDRKHYFYADLPAGYQITQRYSPFALGGQISLEDTPYSKAIRIQQIQLEQDTAKSTFDPRDTATAIDLNRAGSALLEIVSHPDMRSPEEAGAYVRALQALLRAVGASDGNMEQGSFRCDVNVSVNRLGQAYGTRCEVKNLNSIKFLVAAINSEVDRHINLLEHGLLVPQETRGFDEDQMITFKLRGKEDAPDYRYMPDSNLPPLLVTEAYIAQVSKSLPDLPNVVRRRLQDHYGLPQQDQDVLLSVDAGKDIPYDGEMGKTVVGYFEKVARGRDAKTVVNWIINELLAQLVVHKKSFSQNPVTPLQLGMLIDFVEAKTITGTAAKQVLRRIVQSETQEDIATIKRSMGLDTVGVDDMKTFCEVAVQELPEEAELVRRGNTRVIMKLVGRVMKLSRGRADAQFVGKHLEVMLLGSVKPKELC